MSDRQRHLPWFALAVAALAVLVFLPEASMQGDLLYLAIATATALGAWLGAVRPQANTRALSLVALALTASVMGDLLYGLSGLTTGGATALLWGADLVWFGSYLAVAVGLLRLVREQQPGRRADVDGLIDFTVVFVVVLLLAWEFVISPTVADSSLSVLTRVRQSVYPAMSAALFALGVRLWISRRGLDPLSALLVGGVGCWLASDLAYLVLGAPASESAWARAGWLFGGVLLATAAWQHTRPPRTDGQVADPGVGMARIALALLPLLVPPAIEFTAYLRGEHADSVVLLAAMAVLVALAFVRAVRLARAARAARDLTRQQARFSHAVAANSADAVVVLDVDAIILREAPQIATLVGRPGAPTLGRSMEEFAELLDPEATDDVLARALASPAHVATGEIPVLTAQGERRWWSVRLRDLRGDPDVGGLVCNIHDITSRRRVEEQLAHQALHDGLTGLANRTLFVDRLDHALQRGARSGLDPAVLHLDIDGFKDINDSLGHREGDRLLEEIAQRLLAAVRSIDTVARLGGDEFAVLIEGSARPVEEARVVAERVRAGLAEPVELESRPVIVSACLGIAAGDALATGMSLLRDAAVAVHHAKQSGRGRISVFESQMLSATVARVAMENELAGALEAGQFHLVYQPVVTLEDGRVVGFEALLRWDHPELGMVSPDTFIPIAERSGLIAPLGRWVLDEACRTVAAWHAAYPSEPPLSIAVNLSARQLSAADLGAQVAEVLARTGLPPSSLILEMTETSLVQDPIRATRTLHELRALGVRLAIDDFGTGYSSLSYLRQFPVDILKLDRSFVDTITDIDHVPAIVRGLLDLGRTLDLVIVAEGIEKEVQRDRLRLEGCGFAQGFLFARPLSSSDAEAIVRDLASPALQGRVGTAR